MIRNNVPRTHMLNTLRRWKEGQCVLSLTPYGHYFRFFVTVVWGPLSKYAQSLCDFKLPLWSRWELCSLGYYTVYSGNSLSMFRNNLLVPSSSFRQSKKKFSWHLKMLPVGCPKALVRNYHCMLRNITEEHRSYAVSFCVCCFDEESDVAVWFHFHIPALAYV